MPCKSLCWCLRHIDYSKIYFHERLHGVKSVQIRSFSGPYFPVFGVNTESLRIQSKYGKYGPEKTPYLDTFHAVLAHQTQQSCSNVSGYLISFEFS